MMGERREVGQVRPGVTATVRAGWPHALLGVGETVLLGLAPPLLQRGEDEVLGGEVHC